ncbi:LPXTG cell wall anchor domain-containing protein [Nocardioides albidus]|uniref:LPXTG cell wall anchor domain-containing protein n=1 Tax=Nocardioides albidus TaxID=1517589 RepID=A0A5C4W3U1_9ACTN|nr:LPXTG cell wall anchor domain-containing protein [Nocardioides albidus]
MVLEVRASANYPTPPAGKIAVTVTSAADAEPVFRTTVHFTNKPVRVEGPRLPKGGYLARAALSPDDAALFLPSSDDTRFRIGAAGGGGDQSGGLPNTGGPDLLWLVLGGALVAVGAGSVGYGRRRAPIAA